MESELAILCQSCGLCCNGSLFGRVPLDEGEVGAARKNHLHVVASGKGFEQPCAALVAQSDESRSCSIYEERPRSCRRFSCRLFERHRREGGSLEPRLASVRRARELLERLRRSGLAQEDFERERTSVDASDPEFDAAARAYAELMERLERDFARAVDP